MATLINPPASAVNDLEEIWEWIESFDAVLEQGGPKLARRILDQIRERARTAGVEIPFTANTPYVNTIPANQEAPFPGDQDMERRIKSLIRWNALAMVVRANRVEHNIGGHISTYGSAATLFEIGFNHFFRARTPAFEGDTVYFQGHAAPGVYSRAFLEGRLSVEKLENFRRELKPGGGLSSYPHPWLMPDFWEYPSVSMGLSPIMAIYQARFNRYLENRGLKPATDAKVWAFLGDGETDEPETLGAITLASRESLDNLIFVINCNLQRLDGPVRGNGKIIQELEAAFRGAGWNVIKVLWGSDWDPLFERDTEGLLVKRLGRNGRRRVSEAHRGIGRLRSRARFRRRSAAARSWSSTIPTNSFARCARAATIRARYTRPTKRPSSIKGTPTVILARTIKGYGLGESGEGKNVTHQQKKLDEEELRHFRTRFEIPISDEQIADAPFYRPPDDSPEIKYLQARRAELGGYVPSRSVRSKPLVAESPGAVRRILHRQRRPRSFHDDGFRGHAAENAARSRKSASWSFPSFPTKRAPSAWNRCSAMWAFTAAAASSTSRSISTRCSITRKRRTARFSKRASPRPARCRRSSPRAPPMPPTASTRFPSSFTTRCSASSASAT